MLGLTGDNSEFVGFPCLSAGEQIMQKNSISIHLESGFFLIIILIHKKTFMIFLT